MNSVDRLSNFMFLARVEAVLLCIEPELLTSSLVSRPFILASLRTSGLFSRLPDIALAHR